MRKRSLWALFLGMSLILSGLRGGFAQGSLPSDSFDAKRFGAIGDGITKDTQSIQAAIDACAQGGGGTVYLAPGVYLSGSIHMRTGVTLWLDSGATIQGSPEEADFDPIEKLDFENDADRETSFFHHALIWGEEIERIGIVGQGTIDGNRTQRGGPKPIALKRCKQVDIKGITILNAPNYCISLLGTDRVNIDGVTILNAYCDGIDPDCCHNVRISNCHIESVDDAIVPKTSFSLGERRSTENLVVTNCLLATECNGFKLGTESGGDFKRISVSNCVVTGLRGHPATGGIALESVDGANIDGVVVSNLTMVDVRAPLFIRLGNRGRDRETPVAGTLKNVCISNIIATGGSITSTLTGIPGHKVQDVSISNLQLTYAGGIPYCSPEASIPEMESEYPDGDMFEALPAYGLYCRHVEGLSLSDIRLGYQDDFYRLSAVHDRDIDWTHESGTPQPSSPGRPGNALVCDDVSLLRVDGFIAKPSSQSDSVIRLVNIREGIVQGCIATEGTGTFAEVVGSDTARVAFSSNNLFLAKKTLTLIAVDPGQVLVSDPLE